MWVNKNIEQRYIDCVNNAINNHNSFSTFRQHPDYQPIISDSMPSNEAVYIWNEIKNNTKLLSKFDEIKLMDKVGGPDLSGLKSINMCTSARNLKYMYATNIIMNHFTNINNVVEIGIGYGGLCYILCLYYEILSYKLVDLEPVVQLAKLFLQQLNIDKNIFSNDIKQYDLMISECALSELDFDSINMYYQQYIQHARQIYIRTNFQSRNEFDKLIMLLSDKFVIKLLQDCPQQPNEPSTIIIGYLK